MGVRAVGGEAARRGARTETSRVRSVLHPRLRSLLRPTNQPNHPARALGSEPKPSSSRAPRRPVRTRVVCGVACRRAPRLVVVEEGGGPRVIFRPRGATSRGASGSTWAAGALASPPSVVRWAGRGMRGGAHRPRPPKARGLVLPPSFFFLFFSILFFPSCLSVC